MKKEIKYTDLVPLLISIFSIIMLIGIIAEWISEDEKWLIMDIVVCIVALVADLTYKTIVYLKKKP